MPLTCFLLAAVIGQSPNVPATDDLSAAFSRKFLSFVKEDARKAGSVRRLPVAFFYGKARRLVAFPQGRWEQAHVGICGTMLDLLDPELGKPIKKIQEAYANRETYHIPAEERVDFEELYSAVLGFEDPDLGELDKWISSAGYALGEFAALLVTWHYLGTEKAGQTQFHAALDRVVEQAAKAPPNANVNLVKAMTLLGRSPHREKYSLEELAMMAKRIEVALSTVLPK